MNHYRFFENLRAQFFPVDLFFHARLADFLHARCAVNVAGAFGPKWDGGYKENFTDEAWKKTVSMVQEIIDRANPQNTFFTLEMKGILCGLKNAVRAMESFRLDIM